MQFTKITRFARMISMAVAVIAAITPIGAMAQATAASIGGPSLVRTAQAATFTGQGFAANSALSISILAPGGSESVYGAVAGADGTLNYQISPRTVGVHQLRVLDSSGKVLAHANFIAAE